VEGAPKWISTVSCVTAQKRANASRPNFPQKGFPRYKKGGEIFSIIFIKSFLFLLKISLEGAEINVSLSSHFNNEGGFF
jgi:hypothetical protein